MWTSHESRAAVRHQAFLVWSVHSTDEDLDILRAIAPADPLFDTALHRRIELGDECAVPAFLEKLRNSDEHGSWWQDSRYWWCDAFTEELDNELERRRDRLAAEHREEDHHDWILSERLIELPASEARRLIAKHWDHLGSSSRFVQAALFVESEVTRDLAGQRLAASPDPAELLDYLDHHWQIGGTSNKGRLTLSRVRALEPYLNLLSDSCLHSLWIACNLEGHFVWRREHLDCRVDFKHYGIRLITRDGLKEELTQLETQDPQRSWRTHWMEEFSELGSSMNEAFEVLGEWLSERRTQSALELAAESLAERGTRAALQVLQVEGAPTGTEADAVRADAQFSVFRRTIL